MATEQINWHLLNEKVSLLTQWKKDFPKTVDLKIKNAVNGLLVRIFLTVGALLTLQSIIERVIEKLILNS